MEKKCSFDIETTTTIEKVEDFVKDTRINKVKNNYKNNEFKSKMCDVIAYDEDKHTLDVRFERYGIRIKNIENFNGNTAEVKYKGEIGKPNFEYRL